MSTFFRRALGIEAREKEQKQELERRSKAYMAERDIHDAASRVHFLEVSADLMRRKLKIRDSFLDENNREFSRDDEKKL